MEKLNKNLKEKLLIDTMTIYNRKNIDINNKEEVKNRLYINYVLLNIRQYNLTNNIDDFMELEIILRKTYTKVINIQSYILRIIDSHNFHNFVDNLKRKFKKEESFIDILDNYNNIMATIADIILRLLNIIKNELQCKYNNILNIKEYTRSSIFLFDEKELRKIEKIAKERIKICYHIRSSNYTETILHEYSKKKAYYLINDPDFNWNSYMNDWTDYMNECNLYSWTIIYAVDILNNKIRQI